MEARRLQRGIAVFVLGLLSAFAGAGVGSAQMPPNPPVDVAVPLTDKVIDYDIYTGRFEAVERVELRARVSGYLQRVTFEDGDVVEKGQTLFVIDQRPFEAAVARAEASLAAAEAAQELAQIELSRATTLAERNVGTRQEVDRTQATLSEAAAQVAVAQAELRAARLDLEFTEIKAPITGRISDTRVDPGNLVTGGAAGATLLSVVVSTDPIYFTFTASEADYLRYTRLDRSGNRPSSRDTENPVAVRLMDEEDFVHEGFMEFVNNELDPNSGTITGRAEIPNPDNLLVPGLFGRVRLPGSGEYEALLLPETAILSDQSRKIVLVVDAEGQVSQKAVKPGAMHRGMRVIREGLAADDRVIVAGVQRARPGQTVTPQEVTLEFGGE